MEKPAVGSLPAPIAATPAAAAAAVAGGTAGKGEVGEGGCAGLGIFDSAAAAAAAALPAWLPAARAENDEEVARSTTASVAAAVGPLGPVGPVGIVGPVGTLGPVGSVGPIGLLGPLGSVGPVGPVVSVGPVASVGPKRHVGSVGPVASVRPLGHVGSVRPVASVGLLGHVGPVGPVGTVGSVGPKGPVRSGGPIPSRALATAVTASGAVVLLPTAPLLAAVVTRSLPATVATGSTETTGLLPPPAGGGVAATTVTAKALASAAPAAAPGKSSTPAERVLPQATTTIATTATTTTIIAAAPATTIVLVEAEGGGAAGPLPVEQTRQASSSAPVSVSPPAVAGEIATETFVGLGFGACLLGSLPAARDIAALAAEKKKQAPLILAAADMGNGTGKVGGQLERREKNQAELMEQNRSEQQIENNPTDQTENDQAARRDNTGKQKRRGKRVSFSVGGAKDEIAGTTHAHAHASAVAVAAVAATPATGVMSLAAVDDLGGASMAGSPPQTSAAASGSAGPAAAAVAAAAGTYSSYSSVKVEEGAGRATTVSNTATGGGAGDGGCSSSFSSVSGPGSAEGTSSGLVSSSFSCFPSLPPCGGPQSPAACGGRQSSSRSPPTLSEWLREGPFALSMSPGFFGFYAHTGALIALEDAGLLDGVSYATGASAGGLVAGLFAAGMSPAEMGKIVVNFRRKDFWDPLGLFGILKGKKFESIVEANLPEGVHNFEQCRVPLAVSAFDVSRLTTRALREGRISPALRATCTFPVLFSPVWHPQGVLLDGGVRDTTGMWCIPEERKDCRRVLNVTFGDRSDEGTCVPPSRFPTAANPRPAEGMEIVSIALTGLPRPHPFAMELGAGAMEAARSQVAAVIDAPLLTGHGESHWIAPTTAQSPRQPISGATDGDSAKIATSAGESADCSSLENRKSHALLGGKNLTAAPAPAAPAAPAAAAASAAAASPGVSMVARTPISPSAPRRCAVVAHAIGIGETHSSEVGSKGSFAGGDGMGTGVFHDGKCTHGGQANGGSFSRHEDLVSSFLGTGKLGNVAAGAKDFGMIEAAESRTENVCISEESSIQTMQQNECIDIKDVNGNGGPSTSGVQKRRASTEDGPMPRRSKRVRRPKSPFVGY